MTDQTIEQAIQDAGANVAPRITPDDTTNSIAAVCHEVNRAYCQSLGDYTQPTWDDAPEGQKASAIAGVQLPLSKPDAGPQASHESWMKQKVDEGWEYGPYKDPEKKLHPCIVPFYLLPREQQTKDFIFRVVVHAVAKALRSKLAAQ